VPCCNPGITRYPFGERPEPAAEGAPVRFATFNASLHRQRAGQALAELSVPGDRQASAVAEIIQRTRPDVLLINELDYEPAGALITAFAENDLALSHHGSLPIHYPEAFVAPSNTGVPSGRDLDKDGRIGGPGDALGFGHFAGQPPSPRPAARHRRVGTANRQPAGRLRAAER
jgi:hypothetical protein